LARVLLTEDDYDAARVTKDFLGALGIDVEVAGDGELALAALQADDYDLLLLDLALPGLDGFALLRTAHRLGLTRRTKILLISGVFQPRREITDFLRTEGIGAFLPKPFGLIELRAAVRRVAPHVLGEAEQPAPSQNNLVHLLRQLRIPGEQLARGVRVSETAEALSTRLNHAADLDPRVPCRIDGRLAASTALLTPAFEGQADESLHALEALPGTEDLIDLVRARMVAEADPELPLALEGHVVGIADALAGGRRDRDREQRVVDATTTRVPALDTWDVFAAADPVYESLAPPTGW
jgi:DNA-binding response OmpR family regulator